MGTNGALESGKSGELYGKAALQTPGGIHSNVRWSDPHPVYFERAKGSRIWDVDGNEYIDCVVNYGALILGHGDPDVTRAVIDQLHSGLTTGVETRLSVRTAELLAQMIPCAEAVRFSTSGTEAVMHAIQIARGYTGRAKILKAEGNYHGWYDPIFCSHRYPKALWQSPRPVPSAQGLSGRLLEDTLVVPWNDLDALEETIGKYGDEIAAVIIEAVNHNIGCALPRPGYLEGVRALTRRHGIVLIFDEIISGFRSAPGGAQEHFKVMPDLATFAKAVANGFPMSVVAGQREIMDVTDPAIKKVAFGGTYNGCQPILAAAAATLGKLGTGEVQKHLARCTEKLLRGFEAAVRRTGTAARMQGLGGKFQIYFTDHPVEDWRSASTVDEGRYARFREFMVNNGVLWVASPFSHNGLTAAHSEEDIDRILEVIERGMERVAEDAEKTGEGR